MEYIPSSSPAGEEIVTFVKSLKEQFFYQHNVKVPYRRTDILPGETFGKLLLITPMAPDPGSVMQLATPGYLSNAIDPDAQIMMVTEADQMVFQVLLTYGFLKPNLDIESQYEEAEFFALQKAMDLDHGLGEIRMRLERQYPFMRTFSLQDRVEHLIEEHKDDRSQFLIDILTTLVVRIMIRKTQDGRHLPWSIESLKRSEIWNF